MAQMVEKWYGRLPRTGESSFAGVSNPCCENCLAAEREEEGSGGADMKVREQETRDGAIGPTLPIRTV